MLFYDELNHLFANHINEYKMKMENKENTMEVIVSHIACSDASLFLDGVHKLPDNITWILDATTQIIEHSHAMHKLGLSEKYKELLIEFMEP